MSIQGAWVAHLVERAPIYRGSVLDAAAAGSPPADGPLLHVIPPRSPFMSKLSCHSKGLKIPKKSLKYKKKKK